ncbi:MAG: response regulator [Actinobacteria bacterium]|nr:response regulator [Actinomycetota bacterium]MBV8957124.1 response regulator [Actinomycetota bacterium]MBV9935632.1 response regulator [Actinomycetota bacterium]
MSSPRPGSLTSRLQRATATVLVVEDEPDIATFLGAFFRASGLEVVHIDPMTPGEVVVAMREHRPACLLLDLRLQGFTGLDVLVQLRAELSLPEVPVVVFSGDGRPERRQEADAFGVAAFVTKPFSVKELYGLVSDLVGTGAPAAR